MQKPKTTSVTMNKDGQQPTVDLPAEEGVARLKLGAFYAKTILDRNQVPQNQRSKVISQVTGLQYGAAHRRARGDLPWTFDELELLAQHFGETLEQVFFDAAKVKATVGEFVVGTFRRNCYFLRGDRLPPKASRDILAAKLVGSTWIVSTVGDHSGGELFEAKQTVLDQEIDSSYRIAVLDDVPEAALAVQTNLIAAKMRCKVFHSIETLTIAVESRPFDAYVLDWLIDGGDVRALIGHLRKLDASAPIFILTGQASSDAGIAPNIAEMELAHGVRYFSKTSATSVMVSMLQVFLKARARTAEA